MDSASRVLGRDVVYLLVFVYTLQWRHLEGVKGMSENGQSCRMKPWVTYGVNGLVTFALLVFALVKFVQPGDYAENAAAAGMEAHHLTLFGVLLLVCAVTYALPKTAVIGAILVTGYFGGAIASHVLANDPIGNFVLPILFPVLAWVGILLRETRMRQLLPLR